MTTGTDPGTWAHDGERIETLLADLVDIAYAGLVDTRLGCPKDVHMSHDEPPEDSCNFLALWVRSWTPYVAGQFPVQLAQVHELGPGGGCMPLEWGADVVLALRRPCSPDVGPRENPFPSGDDEHAAALDMIGDARALQCVVGSQWLPRLQQLYGGAQLWWEPMTTTGGITGCFGWDMPVKLELYGCKTGC
jgi:hypothetical protein